MRIAYKICLLAVGMIAAELALEVFDRHEHANQEENEQYCDMVHDGLWPDYQHTYSAECEQARVVK